MSLVLVTGSTDGIGRETARQLVEAGHDVVAHARNRSRADDVREALPGLVDVVVGDLASLEQTRGVAEAASRLGPFDTVVHNAGLGGNEPEPVRTDDGMERLFQVNVAAPYLLTALVPRPARLVYLASGLESRGQVTLEDLQWEQRRWNGMQAYSESKLYDVMLALAVDRLWPQVRSTAVDPGWIRTRMGGAHADDDVSDGAETQVWLATADEATATGVSGQFLKRRQVLRPNPQALDVALQDALLERLAGLTGERLA